MEAEGKILVQVKSVSKKFSKDFKKSLQYGLTDLTKELFGHKRNVTLRKTEFWAVRNVSFNLRKGKCLSIVGHNGAGKSTLLKMLNGIIKPDEGEITIHGRVGALIELGAGFNPILTGRENVFSYGIVLGFTHQEILNKYADIVEFAEMGEFMETPIQNYSSGMKIRLGFAVAAQMEPDVLIIDEVLAVGDVKFRIKCFNKIAELASSCAIIFVSHNVQHVSRISNLLIFMESGQSTDYGRDVDAGMRKYLKHDVEIKSKSKEIRGMKILDSRAKPFKDRIEFQFQMLFENKMGKVFFELDLFDSELKLIAKIPSDGETFDIDNENQTISIKAVSQNHLTSGKFVVNIWAFRLTQDGKKIVGNFQNAMAFEIEGEAVSATKVVFDADWSLGSFSDSQESSDQ